LAQEAIDHSKDKRIAFVSTPAAYRDFLKIQEESDSPVNGANVFLLEFDRRFDEKYSGHFVFYDYNEPTNLPEKFHHFFDYVLVDPPYLVRWHAWPGRGELALMLFVSPGRTPTAWASSRRPCAGCPRTWRPSRARRTRS
jgi:hypothetical protein